MEGKRVDSKLLLFTLVLVLITLLLLNFLLKGNKVNDVWDYKKIKSAQDVIYLGQRTEDRQIYYTLEEVISEYLDSYLSKDLTYKDYYQFLRSDYKKHLGRGKYLKVAENFMNKFNTFIDEDYQSMEKTDIIKSIYEFNDNVYMCRLQSNRSEEYDEMEEGYIAVQLSSRDNMYYIVYIE